MKLAQLTLMLGPLMMSAVAFASSSGIYGYSGEDGATCNSCHSGGTVPTVTISGPASFSASQTGTYTVTVTGGAAVRAGVGISVAGSGAELRAGTNTQALGASATHRSPVAMSGGSAVFTVQLAVPSTGGSFTIFAAGLSANGSGGNSGDRAGTASKVVTVAGIPGGPTVTQNAAANPATIAGASTAVSVLGNDDSGEAAIVYTWAATGPAAVTFDANGTNTSKNTTARFTKAGSYSLTATLRDPGGLTSTSSVSVVVQAALTSLRVSPETTEVLAGQTQQFTAVGVDQFGAVMNPPPAVDWSVTRGGTISTSGLYQAQSAPGGPFSVAAAGGGKIAAATVSVVEKLSDPAPSPGTTSPGNGAPANTTPEKDQVITGVGCAQAASRGGLWWLFLAMLPLALNRRKSLARRNYG